MLSTRPPSISNINPPTPTPPMADPSANVPGVLDSSPGGETGNCDAPDTSSATSSSQHKSHDAPLCDMTKSLPDPSSFNVSDGPLTNYIYNLKLYRKDNPKNCIIGHLNINSILNKFEAVECISNDALIDVFALSEFKIDESFPSAQFIVNDFSLHRKDKNRLYCCICVLILHIDAGLILSQTMKSHMALKLWLLK